MWVAKNSLSTMRFAAAKIDAKLAKCLDRIFDLVPYLPHVLHRLS